MIVRDLLTRWKIVVDNKTLNQLDRQIRQTKKNFNEAGKASIKFGKNLSLFVTTPLLGLGGVLVKTASDAEEGASKFGTVFQSISKEADQTAESLRKSFGLSRAQSKALLADTGDLLTGFGFTQDSALDLSKQVNELAVDLASFTNFSGGAEGASKALTKALLGERESIKSLGISILEEDVKRRVALNTANGMTFASERQAKAFATLQLAQEQSKNAIGDFARTNQQFANRARIMRARLNDLAVSFGKILLPPALKLMNVFVKMLDFLDSLDPTVKSIILGVLGLAAALGPLLIGLGLFIKAMTLVKGSIDIAKVALTKFSITGVLSFLAMIAVVTAVILILEDLLAFFQGRDSVTGVIVDGFNKAVDAINEKISGMNEFLRAALLGALLPIRAVINGLQALGGAIGAIVGGDFSLLKDVGAKFLKDTFAFDTGDIGAALGFGADERTFRIPQSQPKANPAIPSGGSTTNVNVSSPITVPPGTPPELVGSKVKEGVMDVLTRQLRDTQQSVEPEAAF